MKRTLILFFLALIMQTLTAQTRTVELKLVETTDVHGNFFPYDYINLKPMSGSLARVSTYIKEQRRLYGNRLLLLDNGDILQGQPATYFYNFVKTDVPHVAASISNYMKYDVQTLGNHDVETGPAVYKKWAKELKCPLVAANVVDAILGQPRFKPYVILNREGVKIAVLGMLTPAIPNWLNEDLWPGMRFENMVTSAREWMKILKEQEHPDVIVGLFHSGKEGGITTPEYEEDAAASVAREVPGFDVVFYGHDHVRWAGEIENTEGNKVVCVDPANNAQYVGVVTLTLTLEKGKVTSKKVSGENVSVANLPVDEAYMKHFEKEIAAVEGFVRRKIGVNPETITTRDCFFGPAAFDSYIHDMLLDETGADISFNAPLAFNASVKAGDVYVADLFNLYKYENEIYVLRMTGKEIRKHLEMSYDLWVNTMKGPEDHIMLLSATTKNDQQRYGFKNMTFNFDSAAGIDYEVDVTKPDGQKVRILQMTNGQPFDENKWYTVAMSSYRGNGGGELLTRGAGIAKKDLPGRVVMKSEHDQRFYLMQRIEKAGKLEAKAHHNWKFVPEAWTKGAIERDRKLIFGE